MMDRRMGLTEKQSSRLSILRKRKQMEDKENLPGQQRRKGGKLNDGGHVLANKTLVGEEDPAEMRDARRPLQNISSTENIRSGTKGSSQYSKPACRGPRMNRAAELRRQSIAGARPGARTAKPTAKTTIKQAVPGPMPSSVLSKKLQLQIEDLSSMVEEEKKEKQKNFDNYQSTLSMLKESQERENELLRALQESKKAVATMGDSIKSLSERISYLERLCTEQEEQIRNDALVRRQLHNQIQELKGNIRVFCRVRPALGSRDFCPVHFPENDPEMKGIQLVAESEPNVDNTGENQKQWHFTFDKVFRPDASQREVFEEISQLVQSVLDGYRVCVFAYGQTGSGKTYTMEGEGYEGDITGSCGMIPRAVEQIFNSIEMDQKRGWSFEVRTSYVEIYNEELRDLLKHPKDSQHQNVQIRHNEREGTTTLVNATELIVQNSAGIYEALRIANKARVVKSTKCNDRSSRSHSVCQIRIKGFNAESGEEREGILNMVDLAGSERLSKSEAKGDRLKETQAINKSLSCLGDVIFSLANGDKFVPYRNSKLTYLLKNSLGGNCKTLFFVNVSPESEHLKESICSLRFAKKVNSCDIGTATRKSTVKK